jgi:hypothetical protein
MLGGDAGLAAADAGSLAAGFELIEDFAHVSQSVRVLISRMCLSRDDCLLSRDMLRDDRDFALRQRDFQENH